MYLNSCASPSIPPINMPVQPPRMWSMISSRVKLTDSAPSAMARSRPNKRHKLANLFVIFCLYLRDRNHGSIKAEAGILGDCFEADQPLGSSSQCQLQAETKEHGVADDPATKVLLEFLFVLGDTE